jgi:hypothetical protein
VGRYRVAGRLRHRRFAAACGWPAQGRADDRELASDRRDAMTGSPTALVAFGLLALVGPSVWGSPRRPAVVGEPVIGVGAWPLPSSPSSTSSSAPSSSSVPTMVADTAGRSALPRRSAPGPAVADGGDRSRCSCRAGRRPGRRLEDACAGGGRGGVVPVESSAGIGAGAAVTAGHVDSRGQGPRSVVQVTRDGMGDGVGVTRSDGVGVWVTAWRGRRRS